MENQGSGIIDAQELGNHPRSPRSSFDGVLRMPTPAEALDEPLPMDIEAPTLETPAPPPTSTSTFATPLARWSTGGMAVRIGVIAVVVLILLLSSFIILRRGGRTAPLQGGSFSNTHLPLGQVVKTAPISLATTPTISVNGQLHVSNSIILTPTSQPLSPSAGQLYYDKNTNQLNVYNGTQFQTLGGSNVSSVQNTTNVTNIIGAGGGVQAVGGQANTIPKFTGSQTLGASIISDNGATVTIAGSLNLVVPQSTNTPLSIWPSNPVPANPSDPSDGNAVELGLKFRSDVSGFITGVRFYKGINNTGAHVGNLWTSSGVLVASAAFTNETATGWQDVSFPDPVPIAANTTYIVSYHTNVGHYAADIGFFASSGVDTGPLHALKEGVDGGNGVFHYGASSLFPNQTFSSYNYWLDPEFVQNVGAQQITANGTPITSATLLNNYDLAKRGASQTFTGDNTFHNASDSTASFSIQNASGTTMLQVDTTNGIVYIGTIGGDSSGIRLVLGTKTTIDDPEGVEGAIYYNAAEKMFRCYRGGGMWDPCADFEADHGFTVYDEFLGGATTSFSDAIGSLGWRAQAIGANGVLNFNSATPAPVASRPGILDLQTPAVANQGTTLLLGTGASGSLLLGQSDVVKTAVAVGAATNQVLRIGLHSETTSTTQPLSGVWWEANPAASSFWRFCYGDGTTATCADSTEPIAANVWESLEIRVLDVGTGNSHIAFTINGNVAGTVSNVTVDSTNRVSPAFSCFATSGAAQHCYWDYFQLTGTYISSNFR